MLAVAVVGSALVGLVGVGFVKYRVSASDAPCAARSRAFIPSHFVSGMTKFQDLRFRQSPLEVFELEPMRSPIVSEYQYGQLVGYVADEALRGRYRRENDRQQHLMGYAIRKWPAVPLKGSVVSASPGKVLEFYENLTTYRTVRAARLHIRLLEGAGSGNQVWRRIRLQLGDETYAYTVSPINRRGQPQGEWGFGIDVRQGANVMQIGIWGGRGIPEEVALRLTRAALRSLSQSCPV